MLESSELSGRVIDVALVRLQDFHCLLAIA